MQQRFRLTGDRRFSQIHQEGRSVANRILVLRVLANGLPHNRYGFMVSKRLGNAVVRNRIRRRLKDIVRQAPTVPGWDAVFIARRGAEQSGYSRLERAAANLLRRTRLTAGPGGGPVQRETHSE